jgi:hypothetical protein
VKGGTFPVHSRESRNPDAGSPLSRGRADDIVTLAGVTLVADCAGALFWPDEGLLVVADLHFEKGSAFARRGVLLPPYDTPATINRLAVLIERYAPRLVIALGDSFHDGGGPDRMADLISRASLKALQRGRDWIWITGNHDPEPAENIGGRFAQVLGARSADVPPRTFGTAVRRRNCRPSASAGARGAARPCREPALFCQRWPPPHHAGIRRLCRRAQRA